MLTITVSKNPVEDVRIILLSMNIQYSFSVKGWTRISTNFFLLLYIIVLMVAEI